ncbi:hypothetical protein [Gordonia sp. (in: high G+C Gram-positive bacteria)]
MRGLLIVVPRPDGLADTEGRPENDREPGGECDDPRDRARQLGHWIW